MTNIKLKFKKVLLILFILQIIFSIVNVSQAASWFSNAMDSADDFYDKGKELAGKGEIVATQGDGSTTILDDLYIEQIINDIYNILFPIGVAVTVIIGGILGIKFMLASAEDKAKIKESLVPYVAGCIAIYGAFGIWRIVIIVLSGIG